MEVYLKFNIQKVNGFAQIYIVLENYLRAWCTIYTTQLPEPQGTNSTNALATHSPSLNRSQLHMVRKIWYPEKKFSVLNLSPTKLKFDVTFFLRYFEACSSKIRSKLISLMIMYNDLEQSLYRLGALGWYECLSLRD